MDDINHLHEMPVTFPLLAINQLYTEWDDGLKLSYPLSFCLSLYLSFPVLWLVSSHHSWAFIPPYLLVSIFLFGFPSLQPSIRLLFGKSALLLLSYLDSWRRLIMLFSSTKSSFLLPKLALMESQMSSFIHWHVVPKPYDLLSSVGLKRRTWLLLFCLAFMMNEFKFQKDYKSSSSKTNSFVSGWNISYYWAFIHTYFYADFAILHLKKTQKTFEWTHQDANEISKMHNLAWRFVVVVVLVWKAYI